MTFAMKYFQPVPIELYVSTIVTDDREIARLTENWNMEREEMIQLLVKYFRSIGLFKVKPLEYAEIVHRNILFQLRYNPVIKSRLQQIAREIEKVKTKHTRHNA